MRRLFSVLLAALVASTLLGAVPQQISYQGQLTGSSGSPLDTTVGITFTLYSDTTQPAIWTETHGTVSVSKGLFNVSLGQTTPLGDAVVNHTQLWLGIRVGADAEMTPKTRVVSVGYAYRVGTVDGASGGTITSDVNITSRANIGSGNVNGGTSAFVAGSNNAASGPYAAVVGGLQNSATNSYAAVCGGIGNSASGLAATIAGGSSNSASAALSFVAGGSSNQANASYSFAGGQQAQANHTGAFVWGSTITGLDPTESFGNDTFTARCGGGARFYTAQSGTATGVSLSAGGGAWNNLCDARRKKFYGAVNTKEVLDKISGLPLYRWSYKSQDEKIQHVGPTAQDFYAAFHLGESDTTISTLDPDGVSLAAIQELAKENEKLEIRNSKLEEEMKELRAAVQTLQAASKQTFKKEE